MKRTDTESASAASAFVSKRSRLGLPPRVPLAGPPLARSTARLGRVLTHSLVDALREAGNQMLLSISLALVYWQQSLTPDLTTKMFDLWCVDVPAARTAERNDPCPCGSGVKFKKCHMPGAPFS